MNPVSVAPGSSSPRLCSPVVFNISTLVLRIYRRLNENRGPVALLLVAGLLIGMSVPSALAQTTDSTQLKRFQMADSQLRAGNHEDAIDILEELYEESPNNSSFYRKLKEAYESVKRYDEALELVEDRIGDSPTPVLLSEKGRLLFQKGEEEEAFETWNDAIALSPDRSSTYRVVYQTLVDIRQFNRAIEFLKKGRSALDRPELFRSELAYLYGLDGQHRKAMQEYVSLLADSPNRADFVQNRLDTFVRQDEGIDAGIEVLEEVVKDSPLNGAYRELLAWLHMEQDNYEAALDVYRAIDRLQDQQGQALFSFAQQAADARQFAAATEAFESILERYPDAGVAPQAQRSLGDMYRQWAEHDDTSSTAQDSSRYANALSAYRTFVENYPDHDAFPQVLLDLGTLHLDVYRSLGDAKEQFDRVMSDHPATSAAQYSQFHLARIALLRDNLERARLLLSRLASKTEEDDLAEQARYELARLHFYNGEFDAAQSRAEATSANTSADVANDAIELKVLLQESRGPDSLDTPLRLYAQARLLERQHRNEAALAQLDSLLQQFGRHALTDDAHFRQGHLHLARGDTSKALDTFTQLPQQHPQSPYADRSLFQIATLHEARGDSTAAVETYNQLLTDYPNSLLAGDARGRLRSLQRTQG